MSSPRLTPDQQLVRKTWLDAYRAVFERADRIVTGADVRVKLESPQRNATTYDAPGWTDGSTIYLNRTILNKVLDKATSADDPEDGFGQQADLVLSIKGVNYHEVAHCMFMPRMTSSFVKKVQKENNVTRGFWHAYNMLEDMKDESLFAGTYHTSVVYFTHAVGSFIVANAQHADSAWPLLTGRKFLPPKLRKVMRDLYASANPYVDVKAVDEVAEAFSKLNLRSASNADRGFELVREYHSLIYGKQSTYPIDSPEHEINRGSPMDSKSQDSAIENLEASEADWEFDPKELEDELSNRDRIEVNESSDDDDDNDGEGSGDGDGNDSSDIPSDVTSEDQSDGDTDAVHGGSAAGSGGDPNKEGLLSQDELKSLIEDIQSEIENSNEVKEAIEDTLGAIDAEAGADNTSPSGTYARHRWSVPDEADMINTKQVVRHIRRIQADLEPEWMKQEPSGYLDIDMAIQREFDPTLLDVFQRWEEGREDEASVEVAILLDQSTSMQGQRIQQASHILWSLKSAFMKVGVRTTVFGFSDGWTILMDPQERPTTQLKQFGVYGGTVPTGAMQEALRILRPSTAHHKIIIALTDGDWWRDSDYLTTLRMIRDAGIKLACCRIGGGFYRDFRSDFDVTHDVGWDVREASNFIEKLVEQVMVEAARL